MIQIQDICLCLHAHWLLEALNGVNAQALPGSSCCIQNYYVYLILIKSCKPRNLVKTIQVLVLLLHGVRLPMERVAARSMSPMERLCCFVYIAVARMYGVLKQHVQYICCKRLSISLSSYVRIGRQIHILCRPRRDILQRACKLTSRTCTWKSMVSSQHFIINIIIVTEPYATLSKQSWAMPKRLSAQHCICPSIPSQHEGQHNSLK